MDSIFNHQQQQQQAHAIAPILLPSLAKAAGPSVGAPSSPSPSDEEVVGTSGTPCPQPFSTVAESRAKQILDRAMDATESQLVCALHRAAMDIFDYLKKDAGRRVFLAERKVTFLEQQLSAVRQQALSMLLRLKADSDAQIAELHKKMLIEERRASSVDAQIAAAQDTLVQLNVKLTKKTEILNKMPKLARPLCGLDVDEKCEPADFTSSRRGQSLRQPSSKEVDASCSMEKGDVIKKCKRKRIDGQFPFLPFIRPCKSKDLNAEGIACQCSTVETESQEKQPSDDILAGSFFDKKFKRGVFVRESNTKERPYDNAGSHEEELQGLKALDGETPDPETSLACAVWQDGYPNINPSVDVPDKEPSSNVVSSLHGGEGEVPRSLGMRMMKHCSPTSTLTEGHDSRETCEASSCEFEKEGHVHMLGNIKQFQDSVACLEHLDGLSLLGDIIDDNDARTVMEDSNEIEVPDFDAVASLAELAVTDGVFKDDAEDALVSHANREVPNNKSHLSGPRVKRKRSFLEKKSGLSLQQESTPNVKVDKEYERPSDNIIKHYTRRPRLFNSKSSDNCIALESSRDSRRLMLGARQLLCLSERKW